MPFLTGANKFLLDLPELQVIILNSFTKSAHLPHLAASADPTIHGRLSVSDCKDKLTVAEWRIYASVN